MSTDLPRPALPSREDIARVLYPDMWRMREEELRKEPDFGWTDETWERYANSYVVDSLKKADAVLALLTSQPTNEREERRG